MAPWLPAALVSDILHRLPVEPLLRFRCLSKSYCAEIDSAEFARCQLKKSIQNKSGLQLIINNADAKDPSDFFYADIYGDLESSYYCYNPLKAPRRSTSVFGSCNGLLLLGLIGDGVTRFAFWNPFTQRYKRLPLCPVETLAGFKGFTCYGFGCDSALDDYKIVTIAEFCDSSNGSWQVWVFSSKSNSWGRIADLKLEDKERITTWVGLYSNGALYWELEPDFELESEIDPEMKVTGFDLTKESFFDVPSIPDRGPAAMGDTLVTIGGNVYAQVRPNFVSLEFYLLMRDNDGRISWRKEFGDIYMLLPQFFPPRALACSKNGDRILFNELNKVFWYDIEEESIQKVKIDYPIYGIPTWTFHVCQESLVSPGPGSARDKTAEEVIINEDVEPDSD